MKGLSVYDKWDKYGDESEGSIAGAFDTFAF